MRERGKPLQITPTDKWQAKTYVQAFTLEQLMCVKTVLPFIFDKLFICPFHEHLKVWTGFRNLGGAVTYNLLVIKVSSHYFPGGCHCSQKHFYPHIFNLYFGIR